MEYREFGNTGIKVSMIGFGGIVVDRMTQEEADRAVSFALDRGVNYFDFAPSYGNCEERLGPVLKGKRENNFLACKTTDRTKDGSSRELMRSLERLQTDHFDLYQLHGVSDMDDLDRAMSAGGAIETLMDAKAKGLTRLIGITAHRTDVILEAIRRFDFDAVLSPINFVCWHQTGVGPEVLETAAAKGMGRIAIKSMARGHWPEDAEHIWNKCWYQPIDDPELAKLAVRFTLSQDVNVLLPSGHFELYQIALETAENFRPLQPDEETHLRTLSASMTPLFQKNK